MVGLRPPIDSHSHFHFHSYSDSDRCRLVWSLSRTQFGAFSSDWLSWFQPGDSPPITLGDRVRFRFQFLLFRFPITEGISLRKTPIRNFARRQLMMMMMVSGGDQVILTLTSVPCEWGLCQIQWPQDLERRYGKIAPLTKVICQKSVMTSIQFMRCYVVKCYQENTANNDTFCGKNMKYILLNILFLGFFFCTILSLHL